MEANLAMSIIGSVTGVIGAVAGLIGAIAGCISYRYMKKSKLLEIRVEIKKLSNSIALELAGLPDFLRLALKSRERINAAKGMYQSGPMERFKNQLNEDITIISALISQHETLKKDWDRCKLDALENDLISLHDLEERVGLIRSKYQEALQQDEKDRDKRHAAIQR